MKLKTTLALVISVGFAMSSQAQVTVFNDTLNNGSTAQSASPANPTANSTAYEYFQQGGAPTTPTIASGDLHLQGRTTTSSISEVQALFANSPVTLGTVGDWIGLTFVFTDTQNILVGGTTSSLNIGLYNSGGVKPTQGVRLDASGSGTGGAVGWAGYVGRIFGDGNARVYTRAPQGAGLTNPNQSQDLLFNGASGSSTYNNPAGVTVGSALTTFTSGLTASSTYTLDFRITLSAADTLTISNALYTGGSVNSANTLFNQIVTTTAGSYLTNSFDGLALGWRYNSASAASSIDISSITVMDQIESVPEPSVFALSGLSILALGVVRRFRR